MTVPGTAIAVSGRSGTSGTGTPVSGRFGCSTVTEPTPGTVACTSGAFLPPPPAGGSLSLFPPREPESFLPPRSWPAAAPPPRVLASRGNDDSSWRSASAWVPAALAVVGVAASTERKGTPLAPRTANQTAAATAARAIRSRAWGRHRGAPAGGSDGEPTSSATAQSCGGKGSKLTAGGLAVASSGGPSSCSSDGVVVHRSSFVSEMA